MDKIKDSMLYLMQMLTEILIINYLIILVAIILICAMSVVAEFFIFFSHIFIFEGFGINLFSSFVDSLLGLLF